MDTPTEPQIVDTQLAEGTKKSKPPATHIAIPIDLREPLLQALIIALRSSQDFSIADTATAIRQTMKPIVLTEESGE